MVGSQDRDVPVGFEDLLVMIKGSSVFWDIMLCGWEEHIASILKQVTSMKQVASSALLCSALLFSSLLLLNLKIHRQCYCHDFQRH
jgi:hypothetical protein